MSTLSDRGFMEGMPSAWAPGCARIRPSVTYPSSSHPSVHPTDVHEAELAIENLLIDVISIM